MFHFLLNNSSTRYITFLVAIVIFKRKQVKKIELYFILLLLLANYEKKGMKIKTKTFIPYSSLFLSNFNIVNWVFVIFKQKKIEEEKEIETMMKTKRKKNEKTS
jgi:hypothetical protein